ncbi:MAG: LruC domain-containing protein [Myxococcota bacterium]|nr:LruC domain-containing protein [Myxococcota bacterium]
MPAQSKTNTARAAVLLVVALALPSPALAIDERAFIDSQLEVPSSVTQLIGELLPERLTVSPAFLSESFDPNLHVTENCQVMVSFLHEGARYKNTLGYFTYTVDGDSIQIVDRQLIFPNASYADPNLGWGGGTLVSGETVTLRNANGAARVFPAGTHIGFFVVSNGWNNTTKTVAGWDLSDPQLPSLSPASNRTVASGVFTTVDQLNPEFSVSRLDLLRHFAMVRVDGVEDFQDGNSFFLVGVEDQNRASGGDNDFNDLVFLVRSTPETAISFDNTIYYDPNSNDPDGDRVEGLLDYFPNDPDRAFTLRTPNLGLRTLAFEDSYPNAGDEDYNDVVVQYAFEEVSDADNLVKDVSATLHLIARGASRDHGFGINIVGLPSSITGTVRIESFDNSGVRSAINISPLADWLQPSVIAEHVDVRVLVFDSTKAALPPPYGSYSNTVIGEDLVSPASAKVVITFDQPLPREGVGLPPYDPFLLLDQGGALVDIHGVGQAGFLGRSAELPLEQGEESFMDDAGFPWLLHVPYDWRYPTEKTRIADAYAGFDDWRSSFGQSSSSWYNAPTLVNPPRVWSSLTESSRLRDWTLQLGAF